MIQEPTDEELNYWLLKNITNIPENCEPVIEFFDGAVAPVLSLRHPQVDLSNLGSLWEQV